MPATTQKIKIDVNTRKADPIHIRVGESFTRWIDFVPGYYDGDTFTPLELAGREDGPRALFRMVKPDKTFVMVSPTVIQDDPESYNYTFRVIPTLEMAQIGGIGYYDLRINDSDNADEFLYTVQGVVVIDDDMITDEMIESVAAVNGYVFPDDFLTSADLSNYVTQDQLSGYATEQYVDDAIAALPTPLINYSETEEVIGTWLDGTTPVYRKVVNYSGYINGVVNVPHGISNLARVISISGVADDGYGGTAWMNFPRISNDGYNIGIMSMNTTNIAVFVPGAFGTNINNLYLIIEYTKSA